ncbi:MFS transporter [Micromonospora sp. NPDC049102]|uniref:MFS transporter n=1 Tax=Micromonospora sp. NPDC049102 TaxID=3364265 RepID=UPI00371C18CF
MTSSALGRDFRLLWSAVVASRFGDTLRTPALALLAATLTRDPRVIAGVTVVAQVPPLLFGLLGGVYADRWDRRRTMARIDGLRAAVVAALAVAVAVDQAGIALLLVAAFLLATLGTLFDSASFALLPALVPAAALPRANGRLQAGSAVAGGFLGAPAAGILFATAPALPFALDAVTFAVAALLVLALTPPAAVHKAPATVPASVWGDIVEGVRWLRAHRTMWRVTLLAAASNLAISGIMAVLVLYALDVLRVPQAGYGLFAAVVIVGGVAGALGAGRLAARLGTVPALGAVLAAQTVALTGFALARHPVPGGIALAVFAAGTVVWNSLWASYGQRQVPAGLLGRVGAAQRMVGLLAAPVGAALAGLVAATYGTVPVMGAAAGVFTLITIVAWWTLPRRKALASPSDADGIHCGVIAPNLNEATQLRRR